MERTQELILSPEERENTPSVREGMTAEQEFEYRCFACELIRDASIMMGTFLLFVAVMCRSRGECFWTDHLSSLLLLLLIPTVPSVL